MKAINPFPSLQWLSKSRTQAQGINSSSSLVWIEPLEPLGTSSPTTIRTSRISLVNTLILINIICIDDVKILEEQIFKDFDTFTKLQKVE
jgi:hypothetical protein